MKLTIATVLGLLLGLGVYSVAAADRPNVLLICVDDLKPALGCYGDVVAQTPHLDRLAARAVRFERAYCNQAVCSPSRNALLVGLRPQTLGIYDLSTNFRRSRPDAVTLPQYFKAHGWHTESLGKIFHVGHGNQDDSASWSVPSWRSRAVTYALDENKAPPPLTPQQAIVANQPANPVRGTAFESADVPDNTYADGALADETMERLRKAQQTPDQPFFLAVGFIRPHLPFVAPKKYWDLYDAQRLPLAEVRSPPAGAPSYAPQFGGELRQYRDIPRSGSLPDGLQRALVHGYYAATSYMDAQLGRILDELDRLELTKNTIVVVWGDHGWHLGDHGMWCKHTNYEQAARIPLLVMAPGTRTGAKSAALIETVDIYPTLCELAGLPAPAELDGRSFVSVLRDPNASTRDHVIHVYPRTGENRTPLIGRAIRTDRYRLVEWKQPGAAAESAELELYDYVHDPLETRNLAAEQPEVVAGLRKLLAGHPEARPQMPAAPASGSSTNRPRQDRNAGSKDRQKDGN